LGRGQGRHQRGHRRVDAVQYLLGVDSYCDRTRAALNDLAGRPQALVALALLAPEYLVN
jgi:hypothetical protein